jgi:predicted AlkP superfamily phosphohydrolase/phosphomutase
MGLLRRRSARGILDLEYLRVLIGRQKRLKTVLRKVMPQAAQDAAKSAAESSSGQIIDWAGSQAYFAPIYFHVFGIEINLQGMRRDGIVPPGDAYETLRSKIIDAARQLKDPETGQAVVNVAARREEIYDGRHVADFPDVILELNPDYIPAGSLAGTSLFEPHPHPIRPGEHRQDGVFVATGPFVVGQEQVPALRLVDVSPTIFYSLGLPVPSEYEGRVLTELFDPDYLNQHSVQIQPVQADSGTEDGGNSGYTEEQQALLEERLRALGYVD